MTSNEDSRRPTTPEAALDEAVDDLIAAMRDVPDLPALWAAARNAETRLAAAGSPDDPDAIQALAVARTFHQFGLVAARLHVLRQET